LLGWQLAADWRSARLVGGDFYDFWRLPHAAGVGSWEMGDGDSSPKPPSPISQPLGFVVADVSDKGVPAAMFMTLSRSLMRAAALDGSSPSVALGRANRWITRDSESAMFVTLFYGILRPDTGDLLFGCAGHNPPLLFRTNGEVRELKTPGIALGVLEDAVLGEDQVRLEVGDILVCYTDGLTEAINGAEEDFGVKRLVDAVAANREQSAEALVATINGALLRFTERPPFDDLTLVVIKRIGTEGLGTEEKLAAALSPQSSALNSSPAAPAPPAVDRPQP
ncbi:MAG: serine/threonine-protein phosphatase, partial [Chloroflexota bacterium]|nr:serine/threonine-protein phosphatase [Chloroflexota bacterium]